MTAEQELLMELASETLLQLGKDIPNRLEKFNRVAELIQSFDSEVKSDI